MIDFDLHQLEYFACAARTGSYSRAARELFVTPQAISRSIQLLEARVGIKLFRRTSNGIALTDFGAIFLDGTQATLNSLEALQALAARYRQETCATLVLGIHSLCFHENGGSLDRTELLAFQQDNGALALSFIEMPGNTILDSLQKGVIDVGITVPSANTAETFECRRLRSFPIAALIAESMVGEFSLDGETVTVDGLASGELVLFSDESAYNEVLLERARIEDVTLPVSSLQVSPHGDMGFVADSRLYVIRPLQHALRTVRDGRLRVLPVYDSVGDPVCMDLDLLLRRDHMPAALEEDLLSFVVERYR